MALGSSTTHNATFATDRVFLSLSISVVLQGIYDSCIFIKFKYYVEVCGAFILLTGKFAEKNNKNNFRLLSG